MVFLKPHKYYSTARDFLARSYHSGRHFISHIDGAVQRSFDVIKAIQPIVAEAANLYGSTQTKAILNTLGGGGINRAESGYRQVRSEGARAGNLLNRLATASGY